MKNYLILFTAGLLMFLSACQKEEVVDGEMLESRNPPSKITVCHLNEDGIYEPRDVPVPSLNGHLSHGDFLPDADGDGYSMLSACTGSKDDCDDNDATIYPGAPEIPDDGIDQDCSGSDETTLQCQCFTMEQLQDFFDYTWVWGWYNLIDANCQPNPLYQGLNDIVLLDAQKNGQVYNTGAGTIAYPNGSYNISFNRFNKTTNQTEENCYWFVPYEEYLPCKLLMDQFLDQVQVSHPDWDYCVRFP